MQQLRLIFFGGRYLFVPLLRIVARTRLRELFTASSLLLVVSVALLMQAIGLSPALGTFLAGVVLASSEYRHELESDLEPFKGLLLGLFFIGVGASINFQLIGSKPLLISGLVAGVMMIKFEFFLQPEKYLKWLQIRTFFLPLPFRRLASLHLFCSHFQISLILLDREWMDIMMAVTAITMTITPLLLLLNERVIDPRFGVKEKSVRR